MRTQSKLFRDSVAKQFPADGREGRG